MAGANYFNGMFRLPAFAGLISCYAMAILIVVFFAR
jgi:hypothetical protein